MVLDDLLIFSKEDRIGVLKEYNRNFDSLDKDVEIIKTWAKKQPHLPEVIEDHVIRTQLVCNKFNFEKTKKKIDMLYAMRTFMPEFYLNPEGAGVQQVINSIYIIPLPQLYEKKTRFIFIKFAKPENSIDYCAQICYQIMLAYLRIKNEDYAKMSVFFDCSGMTFSHLANINPIYLKRSLKHFEKVFSTVLNEIHLYNVPSFANSLLTLITSMYKLKSHQQFQFHNSIESIHKVIPKKILPKDYEGDEKSLQELNELWKEEFHNQSQWILEEFAKKSNESLRPEKLEENDIFGTEGNFRKLDFD